jgi:hypothetical protein
VIREINKKDHDYASKMIEDVLKDDPIHAAGFLREIGDSTRAQEVLRRAFSPFASESEIEKMFGFKFDSK